MIFSHLLLSSTLRRPLISPLFPYTTLFRSRLFAREKIRVALAARKIEKLGALCSETGARAYPCDATNPDEVERLFGLVEREIGPPDLVVYNASARARGALVDLVPADVQNAIAVSAFGGFLV